ncbi:MAG: efflux RND transporter periplasmic adaptor subunit [Desulfobacterales bacterium]|jgi:RND family efflux transporter MFP subunit|nr:efflux RND transporter periplasmic adaptor subunit [Desulfobacterales bacterium]MDH3826700.1 efflux RND transporter periplasmic adaptor subunit [Desulfobacterales bacterium]MDH3876948.1 efflux RND transporter periplasmic adaptor subunit [Desulfobacterales bacterium]MDH4010122.1 efflux RND transporter periplasmic adaptor subunit [Desulfobacterales bacterium]
MRLSRFFLRAEQTIIFLIAVLLSTIFIGCSEKNEYVEPPAPQVTVSKPLVQNVTDYLEFTGSTKAIEEIEIRARVKGFLESVHFEDGDFVTKGQLLFNIDPKPYKAAVESARGRLGKHQAQLERAQKEYQRNLTLFKQNAASEANVVKWKSEVEESKAAVVSAQAALDKARLDLGYCTINSPISGRISRKQVDVGNLVGASENTLLTTIRQWTPIYVYFSINERDLLRIMERARAEGITADNPDKIPLDLGLANETGFPHEGHLDFVDSTVDPGTGTMQLRGLFPNAGPPYFIVPGLFVRVRMPVAERENALLVTERALGLDQGGRYLLVVDNENKVEQRYVKIGALRDGMRVIEDGLKPEDQVVVKGIQRAIPGAKVTPQQAQAVKPDKKAEPAKESDSPSNEPSKSS